MEQTIAIGAIVEATDGHIGNVTQVVTQPGSTEITQLIVENAGHSKQFTIPAGLIASQVGTQIVKLNISSEELFNNGVELEVDTNTSNYAHPTPPISD